MKLVETVARFVDEVSMLQADKLTILSRLSLVIDGEQIKGYQLYLFIMMSYRL